MKRIAFLITLMILAVNAFGAYGLNCKTLTIIDEFGDYRTDVNTITIYAAGTSTKSTLYDTANKDTQIANTVADCNGYIKRGGVTFWSTDITYDVTVTNDDGQSIHKAGLTASATKLMFPSFYRDFTGLSLSDSNDLIFGTDSDWVVDCDTAKRLDAIPKTTTDDSVFAIGDADHTSDILWYTKSASSLMTGDASADLLYFNGIDTRWQDSDYVKFGDSDDVTLAWDGDSFNIAALAADQDMEIGGTTTGFDIHYYFETAGEFFIDYDGDFINLTDDMDLRFGTGASDNGDFQISSNSSNVLAIEQVVSGTGTITVGADNKGIDWTWYAELASDYMKWDQDGQTQGALIFEDSHIMMMDDTTMIFGDGADATLQYDEDGDDNLQLSGADLCLTNVDLVYEGSTADGNETTITATDPTADRTITWPNASGIVTLNTLAVEEFDANDTLTATEYGKVCSVVGKTLGGQVDLTLPTAVAGAHFYVVDANATAACDVLVKPNTDDTIHGSSSGILCDLDNADAPMIHLIAISAVEWKVVGNVEVDQTIAWKEQ